MKYRFRTSWNDKLILQVTERYFNAYMQAVTTRWVDCKTEDLTFELLNKLNYSEKERKNNTSC